LKDDRPWFLYIVACSDDSFYTGISTDIERRVVEHNKGQGSRYTAMRLPVCLKAAWSFPDQGAALKAEKRLKSRQRAFKMELIRSSENYGEGKRIYHDGRYLD